MSDEDDFVTRSAAVREAVQASTRHALERFAASYTLSEPEAPMGVWVVARDHDGRARLTMSAHADSVNFVLGDEAFLYFIDAPYDIERLRHEITQVIDGAFSSSLQIVVDGVQALLITASGEQIKLVVPA